MLNFNEYFNCELSENWCAEEDGDNLLMYNPDGKGAMTLSFFNALAVGESLDEQVSILAKRFIDQNNINLHSSMILCNRECKTILYGTGTTFDGWFIKLWIVAQHPKIVFATYQSERKNNEIRMCDSIIDSIKFTL